MGNLGQRRVGGGGEGWNEFRGAMDKQGRGMKEQQLPIQTGRRGRPTSKRVMKRARGHVAHLKPLPHQLSHIVAEVAVPCQQHYQGFRPPPAPETATTRRWQQGTVAWCQGPTDSTRGTRNGRGGGGDGLTRGCDPGHFSGIGPWQPSLPGPQPPASQTPGGRWKVGGRVRGADAHSYPCQLGCRQSA